MTAASLPVYLVLLQLARQLYNLKDAGKIVDFCAQRLVDSAHINYIHNPRTGSD